LNQPLDNEALLLGQLKGGNPEAFTVIYRHYSSPMYINVLKMVKDEDRAHDIVQELFTRIWQKRETIQIDQSFAGYLYRVGQRLVIDFYRKLKQDKKLYAYFKSVASDNYTHIEEGLNHREHTELFEKAITSLSPQQQKAYRLCKVQGLSHSEAARELDLSVLTVKKYIVRANLAIQDYFHEHSQTAIGLLFLAILLLPE
jgi:RNA polymerase sigma factor (sigma-70 family)